MVDFEVIGKVVVDNSGTVSIQGLNSEIDKIGSSTASAGEQTSWFGNIAQYVWANIVLEGIKAAWNALTSFISEGFAQIQQYEMLSASLTTLTAKEMLVTGQAESMSEALGMSGERAEELLNWVQQIAIESPFTQEGVAQAFRMALAYGFTTEEAQRLTQAMLDFAAGSGASEASMQAIARALGQMSATGKVTAQDMMQLINAGLPVVEILAEGFGVTTAQLMDMRSKGLLPATEAIEYITTYLETNFAGAGERMANTWAGLSGTFQDLKAMGLREFFGGIAEVIQPIAVAFANWLQDEGIDKLRVMGESLGQMALPLGTILQIIIALTTGNGLMELGIQLREMGESYPAFQALGSALITFQQAIDSGATGLDAFIAAMQKFADLSGNTTLQGLLDVFMPALESIRSAAEIVGSTLVGAIESFANALGSSDVMASAARNFEGVKEVVRALYDLLVDLAQNVLAFLGEQFNKISLWVAENRDLIDDYAIVASNLYNNVLVPGWKLVFDLISVLWDVVEPLLGGLVDIGLELARIFMLVATGDWEGVRLAIGNILETIVNSLAEAITNLVDGILGMFGTSTDEIGASIATMFENGIFNVEARVKTEFEDWWGRVTASMNNIEADWQSFVDDMNDFEAEATTAVQGWWERVTEEAREVKTDWQKFVDDMNAFEAEATEAFRDWWIRVTTPQTAAEQMAANRALNDAFITSLNTWEAEATVNFREWFLRVTEPPDVDPGYDVVRGWIDSLNNWEAEATASFREWFLRVSKPPESDLGLDTIHGWIDSLNEFEAMMKTAVSEWWGRVTESPDVDPGYDIVRGWIDGLNNWEAYMKEAVGEWWRRVIAPADSDLGLDIIQGWIDSLNEWKDYMKEEVRKWWESVTEPMYGSDIGHDIVLGLLDGLNEWEQDMFAWVDEHIISPVKRALGISSPSTVFFQIGMDVITGLIQGVFSLLSALGSIGLIIGVGLINGLISGFQMLVGIFYSVIETFVGNIADKFNTMLTKIKDVFDKIKLAWEESGLSGVLELLVGGISLGGTTGTVGGGTGDTGHTRDGGTSGGECTIINNFYGAVNVGSMEELYQCPTPHPIVGATAGGLVLNGGGTIGSGTGGGGTRPPRGR